MKTRSRLIRRGMRIGEFENGRAEFMMLPPKRDLLSAQMVVRCWMGLFVVATAGPGPSEGLVRRDVRWPSQMEPAEPVQPRAKERCEAGPGAPERSDLCCVERHDAVVNRNRDD